MKVAVRLLIAGLTIVLVAVVGFVGYVWYFERHSSYIRIEYQAKDFWIIEFNPGVARLEELVTRSGLSRDRAILTLLDADLSDPRIHALQCQIEQVWGEVGDRVLARVRCPYTSAAL